MKREEAIERLKKEYEGIGNLIATIEADTEYDRINVDSVCTSTGMMESTNEHTGGNQMWITNGALCYALLINVLPRENVNDMIKRVPQPPTV